jgi:hypothetical protein
MSPQPDPAVQDLANLAVASEALARLASINNGVFWGTETAAEIARLLPRLGRKLTGAAHRAATFQFPPVVTAPPSSEMLPVPLPSAPAVDPLLERVAMLPLREARAIFEAAYLAAVVVRHKGNVQAASKAAGMERSALHRKLKELGVEVQREPGRTRARRKIQSNAEGSV